MGSVNVELASTKVEQIRYLRYTEGLTVMEAAGRVGVSRESVRKYAPGRVNKIDNTLIREAFLKSPVTAFEVARQLGWEWKGSADGARVKRTLGINLESSGNGRGGLTRTYRRLVDVETVARIADAIGVGAWEVGA